MAQPWASHRELLLTRHGVLQSVMLVALLAHVPAAAGTAALHAQQAHGVTPLLSVRTRTEAWDWFDTTSADAYIYGHAMARFGLERARRTVGWRIELSAPLIVGLPIRATQGHGAAYYRANGRRRTVAGVIPKQVYVTVGSPARGHRVRVGRFEFSDGGEATPVDPGLAAVKRGSVVQRLIGPFGFTQGGRSLDGLEYGWRKPGLTLSLLGAVPTIGIFNLDGLDHLSEMPLAYAGLTRETRLAGTPGEWRLFTVAMRDGRGLAPVDNRPLAERSNDRERIEVVSLGGHFLQLVASDAGPFDIAAWGVGQLGHWGTQRHSAWAVDVEAGWRPDEVPLRPWIRAGVFRTSGDRTPSDDTHGTFYQTLATPRLFARFPFYNLTNVRDIWGSVLVRPARQIVVRADVRSVGVGEQTDGWYQGSGPFDRSSFGLGYRPVSLSRHLATLIDLSADWSPARQWTLSAYAGHAFAGRAIGEVMSGRFGFLELEYRR